MKRGRGMEDREERSKGIEIRITNDLVIIKPTAPFKFAKHEALRKRNWSDSSGNLLCLADGEAGSIFIFSNFVFEKPFFETIYLKGP